jgi:uncharacterized membrane protein
MERMTGDRGTSRRRWRVALIVSLALNLFLVGLVGIWAVRPMFRGPPSPPDFSRTIDRMAHRLSDADAAILRRAYAAHRDSILQRSREVETARRTVRRTLRSEPFDPDALAHAMDDIRKARTAFEQTLQDVMREAAAEISPDGRRILSRGPHGR